MMGFFSNLFAKQNCAVCGKECGTLHRSKLRDGQFLCDDCGNKCSKYIRLSELTLDEAKEHMEYMARMKRVFDEVFNKTEFRVNAYPSTPTQMGLVFCDELGTMPAFDILPLFSAGRSRKLTLVPIIQSLAQLEKNYGKEGAEIIQDNVQDTIFGGFAPNSQTAEVLSKALGNRTVMSGSISRGKNDPSQSLQMIGRPLMTPDELKSIPKGQFIVMKTGTHPMRTRLRLFLEWGITFGEPYVLPEKAARKVAYASRNELEAAIDAHVRNQAAVQAETTGTGPAPAVNGPQTDKNDPEQPKSVDLRTDREVV